MRVIGGYLVREISFGILLVMLGFLGLFAFFDLIAEIDDIGRAGYRMQHAALYVLLGLPSHVYELMPVAALIGCIYALAQFASSSEFTAMRAAGMSRGHALRSVVGVGIVLAVLTSIAGEWVAPVSQRLAETLRATHLASTLGGEFRSGLWLKDSRVDPLARKPGERLNRFVNVGQLRADGRIERVEIHEFDAEFRLKSIVRARSGEFHRTRRPATAGDANAATAATGPAADGRPDRPGAQGAASGEGADGTGREIADGEGYWQLDDIERTRFELRTDARGDESLRADFSRAPTMRWASDLTPDILAVLTLDPDRMSAWALWRYVSHLKDNGQNANRYEVALWKKLIYPIAIVIMLMLALPFGYIQARAGSVGLKLFAGIMLGVAFYFMNGLFSNLGMLNTWPPWVAVSIPSIVAFVLALTMLGRVGRSY
ncbi:MAG: LPS export ABC transporter permease LptG [Lautropia sp.]